MRTRKPIMWLPSVDLKRRFHDDVSQLPYRDGEGWFLRTEQGPAVQMSTVREALRRSAAEPAGFQVAKEKIMLIIHCLVWKAIAFDPRPLSQTWRSARSST